MSHHANMAIFHYDSSYFRLSLKCHRPLIKLQFFDCEAFHIYCIQLQRCREIQGKQVERNQSKNKTSLTFPSAKTNWNYMGRQRLAASLKWCLNSMKQTDTLERVNPKTQFDIILN